MHIDKDYPYKRRIRIEGTLGRVDRYSIAITDIETGEPITNIMRIVIRLDAGRVNEADITYAEEDESGKIIKGPDGDLIENTITVENPEIDVSALEIEKTRQQ